MSCISYYTLRSSTRTGCVKSMMFANGNLSALKHAYLIVHKVKLIRKKHYGYATANLIVQMRENNLDVIFVFILPHPSEMNLW